MPRGSTAPKGTMGEGTTGVLSSICGLIAACELYVSVRFGRDEIGGGVQS